MIENIIEVLMILANTAVIILNKTKAKPVTRKVKANRIIPIKDESWKQKLP